MYEHVLLRAHQEIAWHQCATDSGMQELSHSSTMGEHVEECVNNSAPHPGSTTHRFTAHEGSEAYRQTHPPEIAPDQRHKPVVLMVQEAQLADSRLNLERSPTIHL